MFAKTPASFAKTPASYVSAMFPMQFNISLVHSSELRSEILP